MKVALKVYFKGKYKYAAYLRNFEYVQRHRHVNNNMQGLI